MSAAPDNLPHFIYRCYDAEGRLLYVGCTHDVNNRMAVHASSWSNPASAYLNLHMDRYEVEGPIAGRAAARQREREVIANEAPLVNVHHNKGRGLPRVPVQPPTAEEMALASRKLDEFFADALPGYRETLEAGS